MVSRVDVIGLDPRKSFLSPIDLVPFLGGGVKLYKGGRLVYHGGKQMAKGSLAAATGRVRLKSGQVVSSGAARLTGAAATVQGSKLVRKGGPDAVVGAASLYLDYVISKRVLQEIKRNGRVTTESQRIKSRRNVGRSSAQKKPKMLKRVGAKCPPGYRYDRNLRACIRK
jgi:hypothetical protein